MFYDVESSGDEQDVAVKSSKKRSLTIESGGCSTTQMSRSNPNESMDQKVKRVKKLKLTSMNDDCDDEARSRVVQKIARFFYQGGVDLNAAKLDSFKEMLDVIGECGPNVEPPSYYDIKVPLLKKEIAYTEELLKENKAECEKYGCSIMVDEWTDKSGRTLINFLVNNAKGTMFLESVDASAHVKSGTLLYSLLDKIVERVGEKNVLQVITNNGSNYLLAGKLLERKRPHLLWTPCASHSIDLMLEDIGKIPIIKDTISRGIAFVGFIYNRAGVLAMMREFTGNKELAKHGVTRVATTFLTLQSLKRRNQDLRRMFSSDQWTSSRWSKNAKGKRANDTVFMPTFWNNVTYTLKVMTPLVKVLRIAYNKKTPAMGNIYEAMDSAKETILSSFDQREKCDKVLKIIDERWDNQLHHPLHAAGYYLNPYFYYHKPRGFEVVHGFFKCLERMVETDEVRDKILKELTIYENSEKLFGNPIAIRARNKVNEEENKLAPVEWWKMFGCCAPELTGFAVKILSLSCSASGCERDWSIFEQLHSKKRIKIEQKRLRDLVFVKYNQTLKANAAKKIKGDPIKLKNIRECDNEWLLEVDAGDENVMDDNGLASGAEKIRQTKKQQGGSNPPTFGGASTSRGKGLGGQATQPSLLVDEESEEDIEEDNYLDVDVLVDDDSEVEEEEQVNVEHNCEEEMEEPNSI